MNATSLRYQQYSNWFQSMIMLVAMLGLLAFVGWLIGGLGLMVWGLLIGGLLLLLAPKISATWILRNYGATELHRQSAPGLFEYLHELARLAELEHPPKLFYVPSQVINAFTVGYRHQSAIAITDGLIRNLTMRECVGVLAHEISHIRHNDIRVMSLADFISRLTQLLSLVGQAIILLSLPLIIFSEAEMPWFGILILVFAPSLSLLLQLALSRTREFNADVGAVRLTGDPQGLVSALQKLELRDIGLFERILMQGHYQTEPSLLRSHPAIEERIKRLFALMEQSPKAVPQSIVAIPAEEVYIGSNIPIVSRRPKRYYLKGLWH